MVTIASLGVSGKKSEVKVTQSCLTLCDLIDYTVHGILQAGILEWVAFPFSRGSSQPRDWTQVSHIASRFFISWATREVPIVKEPTCNAGEGILSLSWEYPLEKEMATHSSIPAWEIPWTEKSGGLQSMKSRRIRHNWRTKQQQHDGYVSSLTDLEWPMWGRWWEGSWRQTQRKKGCDCRGVLSNLVIKL